MGLARTQASVRAKRSSGADGRHGQREVERGTLLDLRLGLFANSRCDRVLPMMEVSNHGGIMPVAKFGPTSDWAGKNVTREGDAASSEGLRSLRPLAAVCGRRSIHTLGPHG